MQDQTIQSVIINAVPALAAWAREHQALREITRADVDVQSPAPLASGTGQDFCRVVLASLRAIADTWPAASTPPVVEAMLGQPAQRRVNPCSHGPEWARDRRVDRP